MKKILFGLMALTCLQESFAQLKAGTIIYERKMNMHRRIADEGQKAMVPEFNTAKMQLLFSGEESIFKALPEEEDIRNNAGENDNRIVINFGGANNETYKNYATEKITESRELGPKKYVIDDSLPRQNWKLEEGTKIIGGYACKKASTINKQDMPVIAWYSEDVQSPTGPEQYGGLPGIILEININDAEIVFTAQDISIKDFDKKLVKAPTEGKKITRKEFQNMVDDQFGPNPGGGPVIRIIRN